MYRHTATASATHPHQPSPPPIPPAACSSSPPYLSGGCCLSCEASRSPAPSRASESARQPNNPERNDRERSGNPQLQQCITHALLRGCVVITSLCPMVGVVCVSVLRHVHGDQPTIRQQSRYTLTSIQFRTIQHFVRSAIDLSHK